MSQWVILQGFLGSSGCCAWPSTMILDFFFSGLPVPSLKFGISLFCSFLVLDFYIIRPL